MERSGKNEDERSMPDSEYETHSLLKHTKWETINRSEEQGVDIEL